MNKKKLCAIGCTLLVAFSSNSNVFAAVPGSSTSKTYDAAVNIQNSLDGMDVTVKEYTIIPDVKDKTEKIIHLKASGLKNLDQLTVSISIETDEGTKEQYYKDGYFYDDQSGEKIKHLATPEQMLEIMNYYVYLDLSSDKLESLDEDDGTYSFTATEDSLGIYLDKILEGVQSEHQIKLLAMQGTVKTDSDHNITRQRTQTVYTIKSGDTPQTCTMNAVAVYNKPGQKVTVELPDLSTYKNPSKKESVVEIKEKYQTLYATNDLNVRAQNNVTSTILGGIEAGGSIQQIGYTSDGWIQILYNGTKAYVFAEYTSETKPIIIKAMNGTMYATTDVFVRDKAGTDGTILGSLPLGEGIEVTGISNNNWIRVKYLGTIGYVSQSYLTWDQPISSMGGIMYVTNSFANVRNYSSTDSEVLGTLTYGDNIAVTGFTSNNWIRVNYNGKTGFIYGDLLSWADPISNIPATGTQTNHTQPNSSLSVKQAYGILISYGTSTLTVACNNGQTINLCKAPNCSMNTPSGIYIGQSVSIVYSYDGKNGMYQLESLDAF